MICYLWASPVANVVAVDQVGSAFEIPLSLKKLRTLSFLLMFRPEPSSRVTQKYNIMI